MRISRAALAATVLAGATAVGLGVSAGPAVADSDQMLPIESFGDIAVDAVHPAPNTCASPPATT
ncbi:hypothetical protein [Actinoplanes palleronii]|uniref:Uncharacterized protein n=1 Tax=Actinoplanes palleronii TaxID=113570 RepID=A0ABQ4BNW3_9ACTN|nr:hypothetical protein [Actinoplanes palleronii]GIE72351.1 hypothetical protein Apa02nite_084590 [Actinoplanes palleronii]